MTAKDIRDPATRAHVEELVVLIDECTIITGMSANEVIEILLQKLKQNEARLNAG